VNDGLRSTTETGGGVYDGLRSTVVTCGNGEYEGLCCMVCGGVYDALRPTVCTGGGVYDAALRTKFCTAGGVYTFCAGGGVYDDTLRTTFCTGGGVYDGRCSWGRPLVGCCLGGLNNAGSDARVAGGEDMPGRWYDIPASTCGTGPRF